MKGKKIPQENRKELKIRPARLPSFEAGIIAEPLISFGGQHHHIDPKTGLGLYGPYSLIGQNRPVLSSIAVGCIGPANMVADAEQWLRACQGRLTNDGSEPLQNPHFPGFNNAHPFQCELHFGNAWRETIKNGDIDSALKESNFHTRIKKIIQLYTDAIEVLSGRDPKPNVILCCIPQDVVDLCTVITKKSGEIKRRRISPLEKKALKSIARGQWFLFPEMDPTLSIEDEIGGYHNLRRGLKAEAMRLSGKGLARFLGKFPARFQPLPIGTAREAFPQAARPVVFAERVMSLCDVDSHFHEYASTFCRGWIFQSQNNPSTP